ADLDPQRTDRVASGEAAAHGARRAVEGCVEPVTSRVPLGTAVPLKVRANGDVVSLDDVAPTPIAEGGRPTSGIDDIGEQYRCEHPIHVGRRTRSGEELLDLAKDLLVMRGPEDVIAARDLDEPRAGDMA